MARQTIAGVSKDLDKLDTRLHKVEHDTHELDTRHRLQHQVVMENTKDINDIKSHFIYFMRVVVVLFASAVVGFIIQGGLV